MSSNIYRHSLGTSLRTVSGETDFPLPCTFLTKKLNLWGLGYSSVTELFACHVWGPGFNYQHISCPPLPPKLTNDRQELYLNKGQSKTLSSLT